MEHSRSHEKSLFLLPPIFSQNKSLFDSFSFYICFFASHLLKNFFKKKSDGKQFSLFAFDKRKNGMYTPLAQNAFKKMRVLKHPSVLGFVDGLESETQISIITERVTPLYATFSKLKEFPKAISWGIHQISVHPFPSQTFGTYFTIFTS